MNMPERPLQPPQPQFDTSIPFDEFDDGIMHDVMGNTRKAKPVQELLITLHQIERAIGSYGVDKARAFDRLLPELRALREACVNEWRDM